MIRHFATPLAILLIALTGCSNEKKGPAYSHQEEFRKQVEASPELKERGYAVNEVRFSEDYNKALVILSKQGSSDGSREVVLEHDGFRRYRGQFYEPINLVEPRTIPPASEREQVLSNRLAAYSSRMAAITVTLPAR